MGEIEQFQLAIDERELEMLRTRLDMVRWPTPETAPGHVQGVPLRDAQALVAYWRDQYDWRRCERRLNAFGQYRTEIDGVGIHFLHIRSPEPVALPLIITHGWPGSVVEFAKVIGPLTDPAAHGGDRSDAFHLVVPSLPGYGFSDAPATAGWTAERISAAWAELMRRLGYDRFYAHGGDWGAFVTVGLAAKHSDRCRAIHLTMPSMTPRNTDPATMTAEESAFMATVAAFQREQAGYSQIQGTKPQTLGYALADSPVGQAMWIYEKLRAWSDCEGDLSTILTMDEILDNIMLYWLPNRGASAARLYWECFLTMDRTSPVTAPVGVSLYPKEILRWPRAWVEQRYTDLRYWSEPARGGHYPAVEQPDIFVDEVRAFFRLFR